jgi:hypothetical protein
MSRGSDWFTKAARGIAGRQVRGVNNIDQCTNEGPNAG